MEVPAQERRRIHEGFDACVAGDIDATTAPTPWKSPPRKVPMCMKAPVPASQVTQMLPSLATTAPTPWKPPPRNVPAYVKAPAPNSPAT